MPHSPRPWYSQEKRCSMAHVRRKKVRLLMGPEDEPTRKEAARRLRQVLQGAPSPGE
jgi:hypothetical protein